MLDRNKTPAKPLRYDGGSAHPYSFEQDIPGMSLRDYFAAKALQGLLAHHGVRPGQDSVEMAYKLAQFMVEEKAAYEEGDK